MEVAIRTTHHNFISGFKREDIAGCDTRHNVHHTSTLALRTERRRCDTYRQHKAVAFCRIVGHWVGAYSRLGIFTLEVENAKLLPSFNIALADRGLINVFIEVHLERGDLNLCIRAGNEVHMFSFGKSDNKLFDERSYIVVGNNGTFVFFYA